MRETLACTGVIIIVVAIVIGICVWTRSSSDKNLDEWFKNISANYTSFSVQGERFKIKNVKLVEPVSMIYSQDFYKIYMDDGTLITTGKYDMIWYK